MYNCEVCLMKVKTIDIETLFYKREELYYFLQNKGCNHICRACLKNELLEIKQIKKDIEKTLEEGGQNEI